MTFNTLLFVIVWLWRQVTIIHLDIPSIIIHQDSEEGKAQIERDRKKMEELRRFSVIDKNEVNEEESEKEKRRRKVDTQKEK